MAGAWLVYILAFTVSTYLASRAYPTPRTKLVALSVHMLLSAITVTALSVATVSPKEPGIIGLWLAIFGPGAAIALGRLLVLLWHQLAGTEQRAWNSTPKDDGQN
ncbi:hypothetical protein [Amycolatopsis keratiniphila]|uniref:Uncharacterized protein n=1 Tax=Amycolatopsis keratiniphila subsp. keratiniphila TaxID=227715 RepID=A0A1W2LLP5_9PSEU|nr:hypothetical protein [Amycolatopsis keratiniphila]ONF63774.1 hypothetical protein AVR91_0231765 [Amycolatopsis keratiniphila subsp. keratiniphila]